MADPLLPREPIWTIPKVVAAIMMSSGLVFAFIQGAPERWQLGWLGILTWICLFVPEAGGRLVPRLYYTVPAAEATVKLVGWTSLIVWVLYAWSSLF